MEPGEASAIAASWNVTHHGASTQVEWFLTFSLRIRHTYPPLKHMFQPAVFPESRCVLLFSTWTRCCFYFLSIWTFCLFIVYCTWPICVPCYPTISWTTMTFLYSFNFQTNLYKHFCGNEWLMPASKAFRFFCSMSLSCSNWFTRLPISFRRPGISLQQRLSQSKKRTTWCTSSNIRSNGLI